MYDILLLLIDRPAFQAFNMVGLIKKITTGPAPTLPSHYSEDWKIVIKAMLTKEEDKRPSAAELLQLPSLQVHHMIGILHMMSWPADPYVNWKAAGIRVMGTY